MMRREWIFNPGTSVFSRCWIYNNKPSLAPWLEKEIAKISSEIRTLLGILPSHSLSHPKLLDSWLQDLLEKRFVVEQIQKHYKEYPSSKMTLKSFQEKRERLRRQILDIDKIEAIIASITYHSHLLLTRAEEAEMKTKITENLKTCQLHSLPSVKNMESWGHLIHLLSEIQFTEKSLQLTVRLKLSFEARVQNISDSYNEGKKNLDVDIQNLNEGLSELKKLVDTEDPTRLKTWAPMPEFVKKSLQPKASVDVLLLIEQLESGLRSLYASLPEDQDFTNPFFKLDEFLEEQKRNLLNLKKRWKESTPFPLGEGVSDFFTYGLRHFELIWYKQLLDENQVIRQQYDRKIKILRNLLNKHIEKNKTDIESSDADLIQFAQTCIMSKAIKIKNLESLEARVIQMRTAAEIRRELSKKREQALADWNFVFESQELLVLEYSSSECEQLSKLAMMLRSLIHLQESSLADVDPYVSDLSPWSSHGVGTLQRTSFEKVMFSELELGGIQGKKYRAD